MKPIKKVIIKDEKHEDGYSELFTKITEFGSWLNVTFRSDTI